jgi:17beta-estradiol 17-dehydrogenase / 3beta-hydroxysteroid 3-dehydrogenase
VPIICLCHLTRLEASVSGWKSMLDVNVIALCLCTKESVNSMRQRGVDDGQIIHISRYGIGKVSTMHCINHFHLFFHSLSGHRVPIGPGNHFYSATKFCVRSLTEGHRQELKELKTNIRVAVNSVLLYLMWIEIINSDFI